MRHWTLKVSDIQKERGISWENNDAFKGCMQPSPVGGPVGWKGVGRAGPGRAAFFYLGSRVCSEGNGKKGVAVFSSASLDSASPTVFTADAAELVQDQSASFSFPF